jgi:hypothetical protein
MDGQIRLPMTNLTHCGEENDEEQGVKVVWEFGGLLLGICLFLMFQFQPKTNQQRSDEIEKWEERSYK